MKKTAGLVILGVLFLVAVIYMSFDGIAPSRSLPGSQLVEIHKKWELPAILKEVSGIALMDTDRIACIEDEDGVIFIYNLKNSKIEQEIEFGAPGDYEAIALVGPTAYILRSDGIIFEVENFEENPAPAKKHSTPLKGKYDFEGLCYDQQNNRLLLSIKDFEEDEFKPIYAFNLQTKELAPEPAFKIDFRDPVFNVLEVKRTHKMLRPTEIAIHPLTGNIYVLEAKNPKLAVLDPEGKPLKLYVFKEEQFSQAEGMSLGKQGELYISNEGNQQPGNILQISLDRQRKEER